MSLKLPKTGGAPSLRRSSTPPLQWKRCWLLLVPVASCIMLLAVCGRTAVFVLLVKAEALAVAFAAVPLRLAPKRFLPDSRLWIPICLDLATSCPTQTTRQRDCCSPCCREITSPSRTQSIPMSRAPTEVAFTVRACCTNGLPYTSMPHTFTSRLIWIRGSGCCIIGVGREIALMVLANGGRIQWKLYFGNQEE